MKAVLQRVSEASVTIGGECVSQIGEGLLILLCVVREDTDRDLELIVRKCANLRIFDDENGVMNRSVKDMGGDVLAVSQFTLAASVRRGNRPSYIDAARHELAVPMYERFCEEMTKEIGRDVKRGRFGADMQVRLLNSGPVTIIIDTKEL